MVPAYYFKGRGPAPFGVLRVVDNSSCACTALLFCPAGDQLARTLLRCTQLIIAYASRVRVSTMPPGTGEQDGDGDGGGDSSPAQVRVSPAIHFLLQTLMQWRDKASSVVSNLTFEKSGRQFNTGDMVGSLARSAGPVVMIIADGAGRRARELLDEGARTSGRSGGLVWRDAGC